MTYCIAEFGTVHYSKIPERRLDKAMFCVTEAIRVGADAAKFQLFVHDEPLFCPMDGDDERWERWIDTIMPLADWIILNEKAKRGKIDLLASVFQPGGVELLKKLEPAYYKVASRAVDTYPYDDVPGPFIVSTGLGVPKYCPIVGSHLLECVSQYPSELVWYSHQFDGLSDHSGSIYPGLHAVAHRAAFLEVHTYPHHFDAGPDHSSAIPIPEFEQICELNKAMKA